MISSKRQFYTLWRAGVLGNRPCMFDTAAEALADPHHHPEFGMREMGKPGGLFLISKRNDLEIHLRAWPEIRWQIDGGAPNHLVELQGEVVRTERGTEGYFAVRSRMDIRSAMRAGLYAPKRGLTALLLMRHFMDPSSYDDVQTLLDEYPDHVIEFASFPCNVGVIPNRNTIVWEVRAY